MVPPPARAGGPIVEEAVPVPAPAERVVGAGRSTEPQFPLSYFCQLPPDWRYTFPSRPA
jgi:hypothetical protein